MVHFLLQSLSLNKPVSSPRYMLACVSIKDLDQPAHENSLIRIFDGHSMGSQGSNISSGGKQRLC